MKSGPISITDVAVDAIGDGLISLGNNTGENLIISKINFCNYDNTYSESLSIGEQKLFSLLDLNSCACAGYEGKLKESTITIYGINQYGIEDKWIVPSVFDCVNDVTIMFVKTPVIPINVLLQETNPPVVTLLGPVDNNKWTTGSTIRFDYNVSDQSTISNCSLIVNDQGVTQQTPVVGTNSFFYHLNDTNYLWDINCVDQFNNLGHALSARNISVDANAYQINDCLQLQAISSNLSAYYVIMNDINCYNDTRSGGALWNSGSGFNSILNFAGDLNGAYKSIYGLFINRTMDNGAGLFGSTASNAILENIILTNASVTSLFGSGGLVGSNGGQIKNSSVKNSIITSNSMNGGLVGGNSGVIDKSSSINNTMASFTWVGGLVGSNDGLIRNSYSANNRVTASSYFAGGFVGRDEYGSIYDSYAVNNFVSATGTGVGNGYGGGFIGYNHCVSNSVVNCYATGTVIGTQNVRGFSGFDEGCTSNCYWADTNASDGATLSCGGSSCVTCTQVSANNFYNEGLGVYTVNPTWDFGSAGTDKNWSNICSSNYGFPPLMWEGITQTNQCRVQS